MAGRRKVWRGLAIFVGLGGVSYGVWYGLASRTLSRERDLADKLGLIKTSREISGSPLPDSQNAAAELLAASVAYSKVPSKDIEAIWRQPVQPESKGMKAKPFVPPTKADIDHARAALGEVLDHLKKAASRPRWVPAVDWEQPWNLDMNQTRPAHELTRLAFYRAHFGDLDGALAELRTVLRLAQLYLQLPSMFAMIRGTQLENSVGRQALAIAWDKRRDPAAIAKVRALMELEPTPFEFADRMPTEILSYSWGIRKLGSDPRAIGLKDDDLNVFQLPLRLAAYNMVQQAIAIRICRETYERNRGMGRDFVAMLKKLSRTEPEKATQWQWNDVIDSYYPKLDFTYYIQSGASNQVKRRLRIAALQLIESYARLGKYPPSLPDHPDMTDPFSGKPFQYLAVRGHRVLYAANIDGQNGKPDEYTKKPKFEQPWSLWLPPGSENEPAW